MECVGCRRRDSSRRFYCSNCVTNRLGEHHARRHQFRTALALVQAKAVSLLTPPPASPVLGVREESELKAAKFSLANRLRDVRLAAAKAREDMAADRTELDDRRASLAKRRANLSRARTLLGSLASDAPAVPSAVAPLPDSLSALRATHTSLLTTHQDVLLRTEETRSILTRELLSVYSFALATSSSPSSSAFLASDPFSSSSTTSSSVETITAPGPTYLLAQIALPSLSDLPLLPPQALSAVLSHLLHLTRLLALYYNLDLPFTPNPSLFDPGRPGLVAAPGWATGPPGTPVEGFPCFVLPKGTKKASGSSGGSSDGPEQSGGREMEGSVRDEEKKEVRVKAVVGGAVALAFDLAWIVWRRGGQSPEGKPEALNDFGALVLKAVGGWPRDRARTPPTIPNMVPRSTKFPLDFATAWRAYTAPSASKLLGALQEFDDSAEEGWDIV